jgi:hypothetical protein
MTEVGIVTFYGDESNIGGGYVPALALAEWMNILESEVEATVVRYGVDFQYSEGQEEALNQFDRLVFITLPLFYEFNVEKIDVPFMFMLHGEGDMLLYSDYVVPFMQKAIGVIDIDPSTMYNWYPCCMPSDIPKGDTYPNRGKPAILYAARICNWANFTYMLKASRALSFRSLVMGPISNPKNEDVIYQIHNNAEIKLGVFNNKELPYSEYRYFWDCLGNDNKPLSKQRLSLSGWQALGAGLTPIVWEGQVPEELERMCIQLPKEFDELDLLRLMVEFEIDRSDRYAEFNSRNLRMDVGLQVLKINDKLLRGVCNGKEEINY